MPLKVLVPFQMHSPTVNLMYFFQPYFRCYHWIGKVTQFEKCDYYCSKKHGRSVEYYVEELRRGGGFRGGGGHGGGRGGGHGHGRGGGGRFVVFIKV